MGYMIFEETGNRNGEIFVKFVIGCTFGRKKGDGLTKFVPMFCLEIF